MAAAEDARRVAGELTNLARVNQLFDRELFDRMDALAKVEGEHLRRRYELLRCNLEWATETALEERRLDELTEEHLDVCLWVAAQPSQPTCPAHTVHHTTPVAGGNRARRYPLGVK